MKCPECEREGEASSVQLYRGGSTMMGIAHFYDEDGVYHVHDPNTHSHSWACSRGHNGEHSFKKPCPSCDFNE